MKIAIVGATGLVGKTVLQLLKNRNVEYTDLVLVASERSVGKTIDFNNKTYTICSMQSAIDQSPDIAIFSAGGETSLEWAPAFAAVGTFVIDNSSAWRMNPKNKLVVPEINGHELSPEDKIIANPNCSTIQLVMALAPLHKKYKIKRLVISTYQSVSGTGKAAVDQLYGERSGEEKEKVYPHVIDMNVLPHIDVFLDNGYTKEEMKMVHETKKILSDQSLNITATAVRLPVIGGHSESLNVEFHNDFDIQEVREILENTSGVIVEDDVSNNIYPMPINAHNKDEVFVGRIRRDESQANTLNMWVVSDNLRKGAATNGSTNSRTFDQKSLGSLLEALLQPKIQQYIRENEHADINQLLLKGASIAGVPARELATQINGQLKAKSKLPTWYRTKNIIFPAKISMEQCSSEQSANYKATILNGERMIDLTGGAGVDIHAFSNCFKDCFYVEQNVELCEVTRHNLSTLGATNIITHNTTAEQFLEENNTNFDLIYLDPARRDESKKKVFRFEDCTPNVVAMMPLLLSQASHVMIKTAPFLDIAQAINQLDCVKEIHVVAVNNECKEVLYLLTNEVAQNHQITIYTINLYQNKLPQKFEFVLQEESFVSIIYTLPYKYIYEPNVAILKSGRNK